MKYLICNLKENKTFHEMIEYKKELSNISLDEKVKLIICPSTPYLSYFVNSNFDLGSQDVSKYSGGAYTGEVGAKQLASLNVRYSLVGHSERKKYFNEKLEDLIEKIENCLINNIKVILFIGEENSNLTPERINNELKEQLKVLNNICNKDLKNILIAYEPNWLIGKREIPSIENLKKILHFIKSFLSEIDSNISLIYGGGINEDNFFDLLSISDLDGFIIGENSLNINTIKKIYSIYTKNL